MESCVRTSGLKKIMLIGSGAVLGALIAVGTTVWADKDAGSVVQAEQVSLPLQELRAFVEVFERVSHDYVDEIDDKKLLEGAISGMLSNLDSHPAYLPPTDFTVMEEHTRGEFGGLGMAVGIENGYVKVISPIDDTPVQAAGNQSADLIHKLGKDPLTGTPMSV